MLKFLKGWKTLAFGALVALVPVLDMSLNQSALLSLIPVDKREFAVSLIGLIIVVLRMLTNTQVMQSEQK